MRPFTRSLTAAVVVLSFAVAAAGGSASSRAAEVTLEGKLTVVHWDDFAHGHGGLQGSLDTGRAQYSVQLAPDTSLPRASRVVVHGRQLNASTLAVGQGGLTAAPNSTAVATTTGAKRLLVVLVYFADQAVPTSPTQASVNGVVFTNSDSVANYYSTVSWGQLTLTGSVTPWVQIPSTDETTSCNWSNWGSQANTAAANAGFSPSNYDYVQYTLAGATSCGWAGLGYLPGTQSWVRAEYDDLRVSGHELGHNFGTHHANSYACSQNGAAVALAASANCSSSEYGDPFSIMGNANTYEHTNFARGNFGWLTSGNTRDVTASGSYTLDPIEPHDSGVQALRIARGDGTYLLLEYRQPDGASFDNFSPTSALATGVVVRVVPSYSALSQSQLVDTTPGDGNFANAPLALNRSLGDPVANATITTTALGSTGATVQVTFGPDTLPPTQPAGLSGIGTSTSSIQLSWSASSDNVGVAGYRVYRNGTLVGSPSGTSFSDTGLQTATSYSYSLVAYDAAGNTSPAATTSASTQAADTTPPSAPRSLAAKKTGNRNAPRIQLSWQAATDNVGVTGYRVYRGTTVIATTSGSALSFTDGAPPKGSNAYSVTAVDAAGNESAHSSTVTVSV